MRIASYAELSRGAKYQRRKLAKQKDELRATVGKAYRIILGSFKDPQSRIDRIWKATTKIGKANPDGFRRKQVENIEQEACGNNRLPSKAAFDVFVFKKMAS